MPRRARKTILVASRDPHLADVRKRVLESAGYRVIPAVSIPDVAAACTEERVDLVLLGYSLPPAEKRRVANEARRHCRTPILELYDGHPPELVEESRTYTHRSETPEDFLKAVQEILGKSE